MKDPEPPDDSLKVTLVGEQAKLCRAVLIEKLIYYSDLLANGKDETGNESTPESKRLLTDISLNLQLVLMAFGLSSSDLEEIIKASGADPQ